MAGLVLDQKGNVYGTTSSGGSGIHGQLGAVFELTTEGRYAVLYSFCEQNGVQRWGVTLPGSSSTGRETCMGRPSAAASPNAAWFRCGIIFKLTPEGNYSVLYHFCTRYRNGTCTDGGVSRCGAGLRPEGKPVSPTVSGGTSGQGVVLKLTQEARKQSSPASAR